MADLIQPGSGKAIRVADEQADAWRARGYRDVTAGDGLDGLTKADLLVRAERAGVDVAKSATKAEIIQAIRG